MNAKVELRGTGLTASVAPRRYQRMRRPKVTEHGHSFFAITLLVVFSIVFACVACSPTSERSVEQRETFAVPMADSVAINMTGVGTHNGSMIVFFDVPNLNLTYMRHMLMLVWTAERGASITSAFPNGTDIDSGQSSRNPFVFVGWTLTTYLDDTVTSKTYSGMHIVMDAWRSCRWTPSDGLLLKGNFTLVDSAVFVGFNYDAIPEFSAPIVVILTTFIFLLIARSRETLNTK